MNSISLKKILVAILVALVVVSISTCCFAKMDITVDHLNPDTDSNIAQNATELLNIAIGVIQVVGISVAVIMLVILAIKYLSAAPSEKAEIKKSAIIYVVGAILLFGGAWILGMIQNASDTLGDGVDVAVVTYEQR